MGVEPTKENLEGLAGAATELVKSLGFGGPVCICWTVIVCVVASTCSDALFRELWPLFRAVWIGLAAIWLASGVFLAFIEPWRGSTPRGRTGSRGGPSIDVDRQHKEREEKAG